MREIDVVKDFSERPFGRYRSNSEFSGEEFRDDILIPALESEDLPITVNLGGSNLYSSSFLEEVFGGLVRSLPDEVFEVSSSDDKDYNDLSKKMAANFVLESLIVKHDNIPEIEEECIKYIKEAGALVDERSGI